MDSALEGLKVLEFSEFVAGPFCAKLLADFGADVIKIEKPGIGDQARTKGPFLNDIPDAEQSLLFLYLNTNKMGITLDLSTRLGQRVFKQLIQKVDVLIEDKSPTLATDLGLTYRKLKETNPNLVVTSITPFGQSGPYRDYRAYYLNVYHGSGEGYLLPAGPEWLLDLNRPPTKMARFSGEYECGLNAAIATLGAVYARHTENSGQWIDISKHESLLQLSAVEISKYPNESFIETRATRAYSVGGIIPCKDGYVEIMPLEEHMWQDLIEVMGNPGWAKDERFKSASSRAENGEELNALILEWATQHTKDEIYHSCQSKGVPAGVIRTAGDFVNSAQVKHRGFIAEAYHPKIGNFKLPSSPLQFSQTGWQFRRPAPLLGEHNEEIYCHLLNFSKENLAWMGQAGVI